MGYTDMEGRRDLWAGDRSPSPFKHTVHETLVGTRRWVRHGPSLPGACILVSKINESTEQTVMKRSMIGQTQGYNEHLMQPGRTPGGSSA